MSLSIRGCTSNTGIFIIRIFTAWISIYVYKFKASWVQQKWHNYAIPAQERTIPKWKLTNISLPLLFFSCRLSLFKTKVIYVWLEEVVRKTSVCSNEYVSSTEAGWHTQSATYTDGQTMQMWPLGVTLLMQITKKLNKGKESQYCNNSSTMSK